MTSQCSKSQPSMITVSSSSAAAASAHLGRGEFDSDGALVVVWNRTGGPAESGTSWLKSAAEKRWPEEILDNKDEEEEEEEEERIRVLRRREDEGRLRADKYTIADCRRPWLREFWFSGFPFSEAHRLWLLVDSDIMKREIH